MLAAAEAAMEAAAEDDAERARIRARLYAPPAGARRGPGRPGRPSMPGVGALRMGEVQALLERVAAEDAQIQGMRLGGR